MTYMATPRFAIIEVLVLWLEKRISSTYYVEVDGSCIMIKDHATKAVQVKRDFQRKVSLQFPKFIFEVGEE